MTPTEELKEEHTLIKLALQILTNISQRLSKGGKVDPEHLTRMVDFIKIFADRCHHGKEEDILFVEMEAAGMPRERGPIGVMLMEHNTGRNYVKGMSEALAAYKTGDGRAAAKFAENASSYVALLTQHIDKEDNILYPMADRLLSKVKQDELLERFEKIEVERIGAGKHEELHQLLHHLRDIYLT